MSLPVCSSNRNATGMRTLGIGAGKRSWVHTNAKENSLFLKRLITTVGLVQLVFIKLWRDVKHSAFIYYFAFVGSWAGGFSNATTS